MTIPYIRRFLWVLLLMPLTAVLAACGAASSPSGIVEGADAPDFTLPNAAGGDVSLADYAGRPVLLYFHMADG